MNKYLLFSAIFLSQLPFLSPAQANPITVSCVGFEPGISLDLVLDFDDRLIWDRLNYRQDPKTGLVGVDSFKEQEEKFLPTIKSIKMKPFEIRPPGKGLWNTAALNIQDETGIKKRFYEQKINEKTTGFGLGLEQNWSKVSEHDGRGGFYIAVNNILAVLYRQLVRESALSTAVVAESSDLGVNADLIVYRYPASPGNGYRLETRLLCNVGKTKSLNKSFTTIVTSPGGG